MIIKKNLRDLVTGCWTQRALVGIFMGGLKLEIIGMRIKPKTLKEAISLSRMWDEQLPFNHNQIALFSPTKTLTAMPMKHLAWDEIQKR